MFTKYLLPILATALLIFAIAFVVNSRPVESQVKPVAQPARSPYARSVAGAGLVEASTENIAVGSPTAGIVTDVLVQVGQQVRRDDPLFQLDARSLRSELKVREAKLAAALADLQRLMSLPRTEQVPVSRAAVTEEEANVAEKADSFRRAQKLLPQEAISEADFNAAEREYQIAQAQLARARAELSLLEAGAWDPEIAQSQAAVALATAERDQAQTDLEELTVRAQVDGEVLQINVRPGEFVTALGSQSLIVLGSTRELHVRVDIDENDIPRFREGAPAVALLKGESRETFPLTFVRVEPYVIPKRSLTGEDTERVDTRVLQVIYAIDSENRTLYVGQQLDVFIDATNKPVSKQASESR
ncbi:MAG: HlyD family efflux transporter periplasmic adaptor subunit [Planctomycetes bacterium]|nr:HlyD family efflux transporter periplasmic adaptor subunit [Planctomycetota bacterium]